MDIFGIGICAVIAALFGTLIRKSSGGYAFLLTAAAAVLLLTAVLGGVLPVIEELRDLAGNSRIEYLSVMLRTVGIAIVGQLAADVCKDAGETALSRVVDLAARAAVLVCAMPLVREIMTDLGDVLQW